jgi:hypothetical protein
MILSWARRSADSPQFDSWKSGALTNDELSEAIHRFHNGPDVELY